MLIALENRKKLIRRIYKSNLPLEEFTSDKTYLTEEAYDYLKEYGWISFYEEFLYYFDFLDFIEYFDNHGGEISEIALDYLDEHVEKAKNNLDFDYLIQCFKAKSEINYRIKNWDEALKWEMRLFTLRINPICLDSRMFSVFDLVDDERMIRLKKLKPKVGDKKIEFSFNENWNYCGFNSFIVPKKDAWDILTKELDSKYIVTSKKKLRKKYLAGFVS